MTRSTHIRRRLVAAVASGCAGVALASTAGAVDLRDWGRKFPASERFVVLSQFNNQAVLDKETQLLWERTPTGATYSGKWRDAKIVCARAVAGGRLGWRLPSVHELSSLAEPTAGNGTLALPAGHPFQNVPVGKYWTATRYIYPNGQPSPASFYVDFEYHGLIYYLSNEDLHLVWCVRGGGPIGEY